MEFFDLIHHKIFQNLVLPPIKVFEFLTKFALNVLFPDRDGPQIIMVNGL
jgi:hypothetical protein